MANSAASELQTGGLIKMAHNCSGAKLFGAKQTNQAVRFKN